MNKKNASTEHLNNDKIKLFNINPSIVVFKKIALIGNSDILLAKRHGKKIDKYGDVMRFNFADLKPIHTGKKTTMRWINCPINIHSVQEHNNNIKTQKDYRNYIINKTKNVKIICWPSLEKKLKKMNQKIKCYKPNGLCNPKNINQLLAKLGIRTRFIEKPNSWPRTGMHAILTCIKSGLIPHLYGFDFKKRKIIQHYSKNRVYCPEKIAFHQIDVEIDIINELQAKGLIIMYQ